MAALPFIVSWMTLMLVIPAADCGHTPTYVHHQRKSFIGLTVSSGEFCNDRQAGRHSNRMVCCHRGSA